MHRLKILLASCLLATLATGIPVPGLVLDEVIDSSDLIVIGKITETNEISRSRQTIRGSTQLVRHIAANILVVSVLKGTKVSRIRVNYLMPLEEDVGYRSLPVGARVIFLKKVGTGFEFANPFYPSAPAFFSSNVQREDSIRKNIIVSVASSLYAGGVTIAEKHEALYFLEQSKAIESSAEIEKLLESANRGLSVRAASVLLRFNRVSALPFAEKWLTDGKPDVEPWEIENLALSLSSLRDERSIPALRRLLHSGQLRTRQSAALALFDMKNPATRKALSEALSDTDFNVRYYAVIGLADSTSIAEWRPSVEVFRKEEGKYLEFWKAWARDNQL